MKTTKKCKHCKKEIPKGLNAYCSNACKDLAKKARDKKKKWVKQRGITTKKLDNLWSKKVKERDGRCMVEGCKETKYLNAHHIFSRSNFSTRWDLSNGICLCSGCHTFSSKFSAHKTPLEFVEWLFEEYGEDYIYDLKKAAQQVNTKSKEEWYEILKLFDN